MDIGGWRRASPSRTGDRWRGEWWRRRPGYGTTVRLVDHSASAEASVRGEQTKRLIVDTAGRAFPGHGYEKTTMRAIAQAAGLSVGNAYYYFPSKDHLVQEFYQRIQEQHRAACGPVLASETTFAGRLRGVCLAGLDVMGPYHGFAGRFIRTAVEPGSPLSPF